jgi:type IX secretion system PorP/SprF family membrane protein
MGSWIKSIAFVFILFFTYNGISQQVALNSQFYYFDFILNPSLSGSKDYNPIYLSYRNQWTGFNGSPETIHFGGNMALDAFNGLGIQFFQDNHGGAYKQNGMHLNYARHFIIKEKKYFSIGGGMLIDQFSGNFNNLELVNPTDNVFLIGQESKLLADASIGFNFHLNKFNIGISSFNLLQSRVSNNSIQSNNNNLKRQYQLLCSYSLPIDSSIVLEPKILVRGLESGIYHGDLLMLGKFKEIYILGFSHRIGAAWSFIAGIEYNNSVISYSYDLSTSGLQSYTGATHEVILGYKFKGKGGELNNDLDFDGIKDKKDDCPNIPGPIENKGCPYGDLDEDGILDNIDKCPETPGIIELDGCPEEIEEVIDSSNFNLDTLEEEDINLIIDPDEKGDIDFAIDTNDMIEIPISKEETEINIIFKNLEFDFDKSSINPKFYLELDRLVELLKTNSEWKLIINGHTDAKRDIQLAKKILKRKGIPYSKEAHDELSMKYNINLSQKRVQSVVEYLIKKGISESRLQAIGHGEENPIATNKTEEGRRINRRVEVEIIK